MKSRHFKTDIDNEIWKEYIQKGTVTGINITFGLFVYKQWVVMCTIKLQKNKEVSVVLLYTQLPLVLYPNNPNIKYISITIPFRICIPSIFYHLYLL